MISDFIKGKKKFDYPHGIQQGISLHRAIDSFTDEHAATRQAKTFFRPHYRLYSGAFTDVVFDYFLANSYEFTETSLYQFSQKVYGSLLDHEEWLPPHFLRMFPYMRSQNWLFNYRTDEGTRNSLGGLVRRAAYLTDSETAYSIFLENKTPLRECFDELWRDLKPFAREHLTALGH